jgi:hypothetical protein
MLETELNTYTTKIPELRQNAGKFVLIQGENIVGIYDNHEQALKQGRNKFGAGPFLVKLIDAPQRQTCNCPDCV